MIACKKEHDYRADIPYWRVRLLKPWATGELDQIRLKHGYTRPDRVAVYEVLDVQVVSVDSIPLGEAPRKGSPLHDKLFRGFDTVIQTTLGKKLAQAKPVSP